MRLKIKRTVVSQDQVSIGTIPMIILVILILISNIPSIARNIPNPIYYGLVVAFFLSTINVFKIFDKNKVNITILLLLYFFLQLIYKVLSISSAAWAYYSTIFKFFLFMIIMIIIIEYLSEKQKKTVVGFTVACMIMTMLDNIRLYSQYGATRFVHLFQQQRFTTNSVNTAFVTAVLLLNAFLFVYILNTHSVIPKTMAIFFSIFNLFFALVIAQRMMILILAIIMYPLLLLYRKEFTAKRATLTFIAIFLLIVIVSQYQAVIRFLDSLLGSARISIRFSQIATYLETGNLTEVGGTLTGRLNLIGKSIYTWLSSIINFIFGAGDHRSNYEIIGNHSEVFDECARYGLLGLVISVPLTISYMKQILRCSGLQKKSFFMKQMKVILFVFLIRASLGSVYEATIGIQLFIIMPIVFGLIESKQQHSTCI